jgi:alpha-D-ribose 1-methylphosphonate 5-triphosphate synthase subunit PhnG
MRDDDSVSGSATAARSRWMSVLALASRNDLERGWESLAVRPGYRRLRGPEVGLVMVRARAGGTGTRFNLGEMTVTRCSVELDDGTLGHAYAGGRDPRHAELCAVFDALLQGADTTELLQRTLVEPLARGQHAGRQAAAARAAASRVEFFTMVRGED